MISGLLLLAMGLLRLGFLANFLSHPVISGFITASGIQIAAGQLAPVLGIRAEGETLRGARPLARRTDLGERQPLHRRHRRRRRSPSSSGSRRGLKPLLRRSGLGERTAGTLAKIGPAVALVVTTAGRLGLRAGRAGRQDRRRRSRRACPGSPCRRFDVALWTKLLVPALLISIVGYVESISVALTLAAKRRQRVDPDQELIALGAANVGAAVSGGFPVTGGLARSVVNFEAGRRDPRRRGVHGGRHRARHAVPHAAALLPAQGDPGRHHRRRGPRRWWTLGALKHTWDYSRADFAAMAATILVTLVEGVEAGLAGRRGAVDLPAPLRARRGRTSRWWARSRARRTSATWRATRW